MPDILAIVSKAVFEKDARGLGTGDLWSTTAYASGNKALEALTAGGALFLVTVRPDSVLWLVAILESPTASNGAWRAAANAVPITDVTSAIPAFAFANGKGLVRDEKLGMSLQTPRELSAATAAALRALSGGALVAQAPAPVAQAAAPVAQAAAPVAQAPVAQAPSNASKAKPAGKASKPAKPAPLTLGEALADAFPPPPRPPGVPDDARWDPISEAWERGATDDQGCRQGPWQSWRDDGSRSAEWTYLDDDLHGTNRRFHSDGSVASEGAWRHGILSDGIFFVATQPTDEPPLPNRHPEIVRCEYIANADGSANATIRFFDRAGQQRDRVGVLYPPRPAHVAATARWFSDENFAPPDGTIGGWVDGALERGTSEKVGDWHWWSTAGVWLRTEHYDARGHRLAITTPTRNELEDVLAAWYADPKDGRYKLAHAWTPALHARLLDELRSKPVRFACEYVYLLDDGTPSYRRGWTQKTSQHRRVIEVVEAWEARTSSDSALVEQWFMNGAGARAAIAVRDRPRLERWWQRFAPLAVPKPLPDNSYAYSTLRNDLDKKSERRARIASWLDGRDATEAAATEAAMREPATARDVSNDALARFAEYALGAMTCVVMLRDPETGEAWLHDHEGKSHHWNGRAFAPSTVTFDDEATHDLRYVNQHTVCEERMLVWPGKHGWLSLQRYGRHVFWHSAAYEMSRGQSEVDRQLWLRAASPLEARRMMHLARLTVGKSARVIDPWRDAKLGVIYRSYHGGGALGIDGTELRTPDELVEAFASHAEAVRAFERIECERMRSGNTLSRMSAAANGDD